MAASNGMSHLDIMAIPSININTPKKVTTPVAKEVQKLKERGTSDSEIVEHLFKTDGLMKPATPKNNPIAMSRLNHKNN